MRNFSSVPIKSKAMDPVGCKGSFINKPLFQEFFMKIFKKTALIAACVGTLAFAGSAFAAGTSSVTITGNVLATCTFFGGPFAIPFGNLDPASTVDATQSTNVTYQCTNGTAATSIKVNTAASPTTVNITSGANNLPVHLTWTVPATTGGGIGATRPVITMPLDGRILVADLNAAVAGVYTATYSIDLLP
jgi:hypothetical protein